MRWLYLHELPGTEALLELLERPEPLSGLVDIMLTCFSPSHNVLLHMRASIEALVRSSPSGRRAFESVLARYQQPRQAWPPLAMQTLAAAWRRSTAAAFLAP